MKNLAPQLPPAATVEGETTDIASEPETTPESVTEAPATSDEITGKVVHILDGDTIDILTADKTTIRIRLHGIDAPEKGQPFGNTAKEFLSDNIGGKISLSRMAKIGTGAESPMFTVWTAHPGRQYIR